MTRLSDNTYDRALVLLALLAPLAMFMLSKWRASLDTWYAPLDADTSAYFGPDFSTRVSDWLGATEGTRARLILIADLSCPCTQATLARLESAKSTSSRQDVRLMVRYISDTTEPGSPAWAAVLAGIPATPTLLAVDGRRLLYAGPVTSGNFCTTAVNKVLGLSVLEASSKAPLMNWLDRGCYCPIRKVKT